MTTGPVVAVVLAAGESRRMGRLKPLLPYGSATVIQAVVRSLKASPVDQVRVVLGHRREEIEARLQGEGVACISNPAYTDGMLTSVQVGMATAPESTEWFVIALGDQPSIRPKTVDLLLQAAQGCLGEEPPATIVVPSYGGRRGHPLVIHARHRAEIGALPAEVGLRELLRRHPEAIRHVDVPEESVLHDMDTPEDYERELRRLGEEAHSEERIAGEAVD